MTSRTAHRATVDLSVRTDTKLYVNKLKNKRQNELERKEMWRKMFARLVKSVGQRKEISLPLKNHPLT